MVDYANSIQPIDVDGFIPNDQFKELLEYCIDKDPSEFKTNIIISAIPIPCTFTMRKVDNKYKIEFYGFLIEADLGYENTEIDWFDFGKGFDVYWPDELYYVKVSSNYDKYKC